MAIIETWAGEPFPIRKTNSTDASYPTLATSNVTMPAGIGDAAAQTTKGTVNFGLPGAGSTPNAVLLHPFGVGSNNNTFKMRVLGWRRLKAGVRGLNGLEYWFYTNLLEVTCTLSSSAVAGVTDGMFGVTNLFADTIALFGTSGNDDVSVDIVSPADDATPAHVLLDIKGCSILEIIFDRNASATSCNCLVQLLT